MQLCLYFFIRADHFNFVLLVLGFGGFFFFGHEVEKYECCPKIPSSGPVTTFLFLFDCVRFVGEEGMQGMFS